MSLVLEIEHLLGIAFAAQSQATAEPDWPPQPDRVFSALVAAWGARGERADERRALEWLETQPVPELAASGGFPRTPATVFVPPNDPETGRVGNRSVMPAFRRRQPRRFPAFRPDDPVVRLIWRDVQADEDIVRSLNTLAAATPYIGHSSSLTRCRFHTASTPDRAATPRRRIYQGRLAELERSYQAGRRPNPGERVRAARLAGSEPPRSMFAERWLVLEHVEGDMPDLRASALVSKALRCALMAGYKRTGREAAIPTALSGHTSGGSPTAEPHLAIGPLAFVGSRFADGRVFGFALVPPSNSELLVDEDFRNALRAVAAWKTDRGRRELQLVSDGLNLTFTPSGEGGKALA
jgi:CRISPR-associated protein Csb2